MEKKASRNKLLKYNSDTNLKAGISELLVAKDLIVKGFIPCKPCIEGLPIDLIALKDNRVLKIQVKYDNVNDRKRITVVGYSSNGEYDLKDVDLIATYSFKTDKCYYVSLKMLRDQRKSQMSLRLVKTKNQRKNILYAENFECIPYRV